MTRRQVSAAVAALQFAILLPATASGVDGVPPIPFPPENPFSESKRVLGKILFWEEQLSSDNTMACGTCHLPADAGSDARDGRNPGFDGVMDTDDDVFGSLGVVRRDSAGNPILDAVFGFDRQVTSRSSLPFLSAAFADDVFWDGRAASNFVDPVSGTTLIPSGGALESQTLHPILSPEEMAREDRTWADVTAKLASVSPLGLAENLPADVAAAIAGGNRYDDLFTAAFGDDAITPSRIAFALATYERTLFPDQTPWDAFNAGDTGALTSDQQLGLDVFMQNECSTCHAPPLFTDHSFRTIGVRPPFEDLGRQNVTGDPADRGGFKVPSLRNVGIKSGLMHNGRITSLAAIIPFYRNPGQQFQDNLDPLMPVSLPGFRDDEFIDFLTNALTDPRVANEVFPFDRPTLRSELSPVGVESSPIAATVLLPRPAYPNPFTRSTTLRFDLVTDSRVTVSVFDARGRLVRNLVDQELAAGPHSRVWNGLGENGADVGAGVYFYRVRAGDHTESARLVVSD